jgi:predicted GNAT superfamily acetyltransferase
MIAIRPIITIEEMRACEQLQKAVWQFRDVEAVPASVLMVASKTGGEVLGAFDNDRLIGFSLAFLSLHEDRICLHSHMAAVLPEYQNRGVGRQLKLGQRDHALARGIHMIEWTFDPLQLKNAHFNVARLGAIVRRYLPDLYGPTTSDLDTGLPTDRLLAEWWLDSDRVCAAIEGSGGQMRSTHERISIPVEIGEIRRTAPKEAERIQSQVRLRFQELFGNSYAVTGFELDCNFGSYLLEKIEQ